VIAAALGVARLGVRFRHKDLAEATFRLAERPQQAPVDSRQVAIHLELSVRLGSELRLI
jgi:hypothetical protein